MIVRGADVVSARRPSGADCPDRLVRDHQIVRRRPHGQAACELPIENVDRLARRAIRPRSRRCTGPRSAQRHARPSPWPGPGGRSRRGRDGARNGRRSPAAAGIFQHRRADVTGETRPWARSRSPGRPAATPLRRSLRRIGASSVAGGQMPSVPRPGAWRARASKAPTNAVASARRPFIFQLPITIGVDQGMGCHRDATAPVRRGASLTHARSGFQRRGRGELPIAGVRRLPTLPFPSGPKPVEITQAQVSRPCSMCCARRPGPGSSKS